MSHNKKRVTEAQQRYIHAVHIFKFVTDYLFLWRLFSKFQVKAP
jgi:hypothetical protein